MNKIFFYIVIVFFFSIGNIPIAGTAEKAGTFVGIDQADGMAVWINPAPANARRYTGRILAPNRVVYRFAAKRVGETLQGRATAGNLSAYLVITYKSVGMVMNWVPILIAAREGVPEKTGAAESYVFVREGTYLPELPSYFAPPPSPDQKFMNTLTFLDSYQFWPPAAVAHGFALIPANHRALLRFYPVVQTDILWKLCEAGGLSPQRQKLLKGQGVGCPDLVEAVSAMQSFGSFSRYKRDVTTEKEEFRLSMGCGQGMLPKEVCRENARGATQRALDIRNVRSVINSYLQ